MTRQRNKTELQVYFTCNTLQEILLKIETKSALIQQTNRMPTVLDRLYTKTKQNLNELFIEQKNILNIKVLT